MPDVVILGALSDWPLGARLTVASRRQRRRLVFTGARPSRRFAAILRGRSRCGPPRRRSPRAPPRKQAAALASTHRQGLADRSIPQRKALAAYLEGGRSVGR